jgi:hypothetical protein
MVILSMPKGIRKIEARFSSDNTLTVVIHPVESLFDNQAEFIKQLKKLEIIGEGKIKPDIDWAYNNDQLIPQEYYPKITIKEFLDSLVKQKILNSIDSLRLCRLPGDTKNQVTLDISIPYEITITDGNFKLIIIIE